MVTASDHKHNLSKHTYNDVYSVSSLLGQSVQTIKQNNVSKKNKKLIREVRDWNDFSF